MLYLIFDVLDEGLGFGHGCRVQLQQSRLFYGWLDVGVVGSFLGRVGSRGAKSRWRNVCESLDHLFDWK
jgi:hypothetical protein